MKSQFIFKKAFTLAEVLITLTIIGVVAALTIPALMNNIQDMQFKAAAKAAFSKASQAVQQMKVDNGGDLSTYYTTVNSFKPVFMAYFKVIKDCNLSNCAPRGTGCRSDIYLSLSGNKANSCFTDEGQFVTTDGIFWGIDNSGSGSIYITVDVNGYGTKPNVYGRDVFMFQLLNDNLVPMGGDNTGYPASTDKCLKRVDNDAYQGWACMYYVMQGIDY